MGLVLNHADFQQGMKRTPFARDLLALLTFWALLLEQVRKQPTKIRKETKGRADLVSFSILYFMANSGPSTLLNCCRAR